MRKKAEPTNYTNTQSELDRLVALLEDETRQLRRSLLVVLDVLKLVKSRGRPLPNPLTSWNPPRNMRMDEQGRRLCSATAKSTGQACRAPAVAGATICRVHGAGKGSPAREKADNLLLQELIGPALWRLKGLIDSKETTGPVLLGAIREVLDRTSYTEHHQMTFEQIEPHLDRLIAEAEAELTREELAQHRDKYGQA